MSPNLSTVVLEGQGCPLFSPQTHLPSTLGPPIVSPLRRPPERRFPLPTATHPARGPRHVPPRTHDGPDGQRVMTASFCPGASQTVVTGRGADLRWFKTQFPRPESALHIPLGLVPRLFRSPLCSDGGIRSPDARLANPTHAYPRPYNHLSTVLRW